MSRPTNPSPAGLGRAGRRRRRPTARGSAGSPRAGVSHSAGPRRRADHSRLEPFTQAPGGPLHRSPRGSTRPRHERRPELRHRTRATTSPRLPRPSASDRARPLLRRTHRHWCRRSRCHRPRDRLRGLAIRSRISTVLRHRGCRRTASGTSLTPATETALSPWWSFPNWVGLDSDQLQWASPL